MLENQIKKDICAYLMYFQNRGSILFWITDTTGTWDPTKKTFRRRNSKFQRNGIPDIILLIKSDKGPVFVGLECKTATGRQSESQKHFEADLKSLTGNSNHYHIVRSVVDAREVLISHGVA